jgi:hypothetical protein
MVCPLACLGIIPSASLTVVVLAYTDFSGRAKLRLERGGVVGAQGRPSACVPGPPRAGKSG